MLLLLMLAMLLVTVPAIAADDAPPALFPSQSYTVVRPMDNMAILYDGTGQSTTIIQSMPGLSWYSQQDKYGNITQQGYLNDPFGPREPLQVPAVDRYAPDGERHTR